MATHDDTAGASGRGCFQRFWLGRDEDEGHSYLLGGEEGKPESWLVAKLKKLRGLSELVAGPKWKNLIRKVGRICNSRKTAVECRYSPESYALNFSAAEDEQLLHTRFAAGSFINHHQTRPGF